MNIGTAHKDRIFELMQSERERVKDAKYEVRPSAEDVCPLCGYPLELLVDPVNQIVDGERCTHRHCSYDNVFVIGAEWPRQE